MSDMIEIGQDWRIRFEQDERGDDSADPRQEDGNVGVIYAPHRRYSLGDHGTAEYDCADRAREHFTEYGNRGGLAAFERWLRVFAGARVVLRVGLLDHSGLHMYVGGGPHWTDGAGWDSGTVGVIFDLPSTREAAGVAADATDEQIETWLRGEVTYYDAYLRGDVIGYVVEHRETWTKDSDPDEHRDEWEVVDSCWGFLIVDGDLDDVRDQALDALPDDVRVAYDAEVAVRD